MRIAILFNQDTDLLDHDPGREAREDVTRVATAFSTALEDSGARVTPIAAGSDLVGFVDKLRRLRPDVVVNLCESLGGDSRGEMAVPTLLEVLGLPYTGSPALALGLALNKDRAKELLRAAGVPVPAAFVVAHPDEVARIDLPFPLIVKPSREDASVGIDSDSVVHNRASLAWAVERVLRTHHQPALVETFVAGREIYVPLFGNRDRRPLPLTQIVFGAHYDGRPNIICYNAKWIPESVEFQASVVKPAGLEPVTEARCVAVASATFDALGVRDYGRVDLRVTPEGDPYVIDVNPNCDLHPEAGFARAAVAAGMDYPTLARRLVELALERKPASPVHLVPAPAALPAAGTRRRSRARPGVAQA